MPVSIRILLMATADSDPRWLLDTLRDAYTVTLVSVGDESAARAALLQDFDVAVACFAGSQAPASLRAFGQRPADGELPLVLIADRFEEAAEAAQRLGAAVCLRSHGFAHLGPTLERVLRERAHRLDRAEAIAFEEGQREILEHVAAGRPLREVLEEIVLLIERQPGSGMLCSILLLDPDEGCVRYGAAPHLPRELGQGLDGAAIGPGEGSCGAAAYLRTPIVVEDLGTHPNWVKYRHLALPFGLRACWSTPIIQGPGVEVLGTFAMYYRESRGPTAHERRWVARATHLAAIAIAHDRSERAVRQSEERYRQIVDTAYEGVWLLDAEARTLLVNERTAKMLGYEPGELLRRRMVDFMDETSRAAAEGTFLQRLRKMSEQFEFQFVRKDGTRFWALVCGSAIRDGAGEIIGALGMLTDITELKVTEEALRRSEAEFRVVFEGAAFGMALMDEAGRALRANPALRKLLGHGEEEIASRPFDSFTHPDDQAVARQLHRSLIAGERESYQAEVRYLVRHDRIVWARVTASLIRPSRGNPARAIAMVENVTERRQMEEAVRASERLRTMMYSAVSDVLFYLGVEPDNRFRFLSINPAFLRATGLREDQVVGRLVDEVIPEPSRTLVIQRYLQAIRMKGTVTWDEVTRYPAGTKYGEVSITPILDESGRCTNLVGTVHDVTERRLAQQRVVAQAALLDKAKDAILVVDRDGAIQYWNKGAERLYGWSAAEALGQPVRDLIHRDIASFEAARLSMLKDGAWTGELPQVNKAGRPIIAEVSATVIRDEQGRVQSIFAIGTDITERKRLEAQVFHSQRLESLGTLAGGIAHDFNNLLTAILANLDTALMDVPIDHPAHSSLERVQTAGLRGSHLVRQLLTFSRRAESIRKRVQLGPLVGEVLDLLRATVPRTIAVNARIDADVPEVLADPTQIHQVIMNLGTNACQAIGGRRGTIEVHLDRAVVDVEIDARPSAIQPGLYARLVVVDTGMGMDAETLERIFDPFYTTKPAGEGTGLGLSVVHGIIRNHEGGIVVRSTPGAGTEFNIYLPAAPTVGASLPTAHPSTHHPAT
jgi:PAS domain S-box-containing protein